MLHYFVKSTGHRRACPAGAMFGNQKPNYESKYTPPSGLPRRSAVCGATMCAPPTALRRGKPAGGENACRFVGGPLVVKHRSGRTSPPVAWTTKRNGATLKRVSEGSFH